MAFSAGKDSVAAWLHLRKFFPRIVPFYRYLIPGLEFVDRGIRMYEDFFETKVIRVPHPSLGRMLANLVYQPPERCAIIEESGIREITYHASNQAVRKRAGMVDGWIAIGTRACDSPLRRMSLEKHGPANKRTREFMAIWDWDIQRTAAEIKASGLRLTEDYAMFARSFDGIDARFLGEIKRRHPNDFQRILDWFPLADADLFRRTI